MARVLIIDDDEEFRLGLAELLADAGHESIHAPDGSEGWRKLGETEPDAVILDVRMPRMGGMEFLARLQERPSRPPVLVLTAHADARNTIEAMRLGAFDHLTKPAGRDEILRALSMALRATPERRTIGRADQGPADTGMGSEFVGASEAMRAVHKAIGLAVRSDAPVLITGETGTGKELVARMLHRHSVRQRAPFVAMNCTAIPAELLESTLFGHVRGAFSGAIADRTGCFEQAQGGCLFLDEIGDMPLPMQAKFLRVLQEKEILPVGGRHGRKVDVRILAATHRDLPAAVQSGLFRSDLYYRLDVIRLHLPPLRERLADILPLAEGFLRLAPQPKQLGQSAAKRLLAHRWPGNVRELRNAIERAIVSARGPCIEASDLGLPAEAPDAPGDDIITQQPPPLPEALARLELHLIQRALAETGNNRAEAARRLGIRRQQLYARMKALGLDPND
ncbi:MAG: sigma-54 dependent transcriptional regulator [Opitutaceae bacterium]|nr:sigma-54 dependent transcriptional regulator [Opitutaceae bacterium]